CYFFFSSRRRHTRFSRDWSSDVCSSDLVKQKNGAPAIGAKLNLYPVFGNSNAVRATDVVKYRVATSTEGRYTFPDNPYAIDGNRSEERRVGKECRCRWKVMYYENS